MSYKKYIIKKGKHNQFSFPCLINKNRVKADVIFDSSWKYNLKNIDQLDVNKVIGFSAPWSFHHKNSARFGVAYNIKDKKLELYSYIYKNKIRNIVKLCNVLFNIPITLEIIEFEKDYVFKVNGVTKDIKDRENINYLVNLRYRLDPYFGGNEKAPHNIITKVKWH